MFGFFGGKEGKQVCNNVADHIGVDKKIFESALLDVGVTHQYFRALKLVPTEQIAGEILPALGQGLMSLNRKFGPQKELSRAYDAVEEYCSRKGISSPLPF